MTGEGNFVTNAFQAARKKWKEKKIWERKKLSRKSKVRKTSISITIGTVDFANKLREHCPLPMASQISVTGKSHVLLIQSSEDSYMGSSLTLRWAGSLIVITGRINYEHMTSMLHLPLSVICSREILLYAAQESQVKMRCGR